MPEPAFVPRNSLPAAQGGDAVYGHPVTPQQAAAAHTTAATEAPSQEGGLPQFRTEYWFSQIVWLILMFGLLYVLMSRVFAPRLRRVRDERDAAIEGALAQGRQVRAEADAQAKAANAELAEARARAQKTAADAKARSQNEAVQRQHAQEADLNAKLAQAEDRIRAAREAAMGQVRGIAAESAALITQRLTGQAPAAGEVDAALDAARA
ncbi:MAG: hypothetical protein INR64_06030 [Caulobacteraceae bacterium]|nr:hypothetical protein [Caulobacter sp.]